MPLSDIDRQLELINAVGDVDPVTGDPVRPTAQGSTGIVFANISHLWLKYADKTVVSTELRDLYVQRESCDLVLGILKSKVDFSVNNAQISIKLNQRVLAYQAQRASLQVEINRIEARLSQGSEPLIAAIAITTPISPPLPGARSSTWPFGPDGNDPRYSGSPYWRSRGGRP